jgi:hypothetical protein
VLKQGALSVPIERDLWVFTDVEGKHVAFTPASHGLDLGSAKPSRLTLAEDAGRRRVTFDFAVGFAKRHLPLKLSLVLGQAAPGEKWRTSVEPEAASTPPGSPAPAAGGTAARSEGGSK